MSIQNNPQSEETLKALESLSDAWSRTKDKRINFVRCAISEHHRIFFIPTGKNIPTKPLNVDPKITSQLLLKTRSSGFERTSIIFVAPILPPQLVWETPYDIVQTIPEYIKTQRKISVPPRDVEIPASNATINQELGPEKIEEPIEEKVGLSSVFCTTGSFFRHII